jgi:hypothetical protein
MLAIGLAVAVGIVDRLGWCTGSIGVLGTIIGDLAIAPTN